MRIEYLELRNYRLFRRATWRRLPPFAIIVGANGSGKSTFFDALSFGTNLEEIYWLVKDDGFATVRRAEDNDLLSQLRQEGDLPGALWMQGLF